MKRMVLFAVTVIFLWSLPVWGQMYRYRDDAGAVRFTDNLANVPEKQRAGISVYEHKISTASPTDAEQLSGRNDAGGQNQKAPEKTPGDSPADAMQSDAMSDDPVRIDRFLKTKTALDEENAQLIKESLSLSEEKKTISGNDAVKAYNDKVTALNARVDDYEKRRAVFQKAADAFNTGLKNRLAPAP